MKPILFGLFFIGLIFSCDNIVDTTEREVLWTHSSLDSIVSIEINENAIGVTQSDTKKSDKIKGSDILDCLIALEKGDIVLDIRSKGQFFFARQYTYPIRIISNWCTMKQKGNEVILFPYEFHEVTLKFASSSHAHTFLNRIKTIDP